MREPFCKFRLLMETLVTAQLCIGLGIILITVAFQYSFSSFLTRHETVVLTIELFNPYFVGTQFFLISLCSLVMWKSIWNRHYSNVIQLLLTIWLIISFTVVICGLVAIWFMSYRVNEITENIGAILFRGMDKYYTNLEWKLLWDKMQFKYGCCGVNQYQDWLNAAWMPQFSNESGNSNCDTNGDYEQLIYGSLSGLRRQVDLYENTKTDGMDAISQQILKPYACCIRNSLYCHTSLTTPTEADDLLQMNFNDVYTTGCLNVFRQRLQLFVKLLNCLITAAVLIHIFICSLTRVLMFKACKRICRKLHNRCRHEECPKHGRGGKEQYIPI